MGGIGPERIKNGVALGSLADVALGKGFPVQFVGRGAVKAVGEPVILPVIEDLGGGKLLSTFLVLGVAFNYQLIELSARLGTAVAAHLVNAESHRLGWRRFVEIV